MPTMSKRHDSPKVPPTKLGDFKVISFNENVSSLQQFINYTGYSNK